VAQSAPSDKKRGISALTTDIAEIERRLWSAADQLRANSSLKAN